FIRHFLIHVLPKGFHRIRHYGLLAKASCADNIARARELLITPEHQAAATDASDPPTPAHLCPCCGGRLSIIESFERGSTTRHRPTGPRISIRIDTSSRPRYPILQSPSFHQLVLDRLRQHSLKYPNILINSCSNLQ